MARNELTRSAREISDLVLNKYYKQKQCDVAEAMGCDPSTLSRLIGGNATIQTFNLISAVGVGVYDKNTQVAIDKKELELLLLSLNGLDARLREKYFEK